MAGKLAGFKQVNNVRRPGNPYADNNKPIILLHMTVGMNLSESFVQGFGSTPQLWYNPYTDEGFQCLDLDMGGYALYQPPYGTEWCNKHQHMIQIELVGVPIVNQRTYTPDQCKLIARRVIVPIVQWLRSIGKNIDLNQVAQVFNSSGSASVDWPGRWTEAEMRDFNGIGQHIKVWGNDHWDCSVEDLQLMADEAKRILGEGPTPPTPAPEEDDLFAMKHFYDTDGTLWVVEGLQATPMGGNAGGQHRDALKDIGPRMLDKNGNPLVLLTGSVKQLYRVMPVMP